MSRSLSSAAKAALCAAQTDEVFLVLLTISSDEMDTIRVVANTEDVTSGGELYVAFPFEVALPSEDGEAVGHVTLRIDAVDRELVAAVRSISEPASVSVSVVLASSPDTVEAGPFEFLMREASYDANAVTAQLSYEDILNEQIPGDAFTPGLFPGVFGA